VARERMRFNVLVYQEHLEEGCGATQSSDPELVEKICRGRGCEDGLLDVAPQQYQNHLRIR